MSLAEANHTWSPVYTLLVAKEAPPPAARHEKAHSRVEIVRVGRYSPKPRKRVSAGIAVSARKVFVYVS